MKKALLLNLKFSLLFLLSSITAFSIYNNFATEIALLFNLVFYLSIILFIWHKYKVKFDFDFKIKWFFLIYYLALVPLLLMIIDPLSNLYSIIGSNEIISLSENPNNFNIYFALYAILVAPILEEFIFRKFLFKSTLELCKRPFLAVFISSFAFAVMHLPIFIAFLFSFVFGVYVSYIFMKTKNILYAVIFHFLFNTFSILFYSLFYNQYNKTLLFLNFGFYYWVLFFVALLFLVLLTHFFLKGIVNK